jgi:hypothetical protein
MKKQGADWLAWGIQFVFGGFVGTVLGICSIWGHGFRIINLEATPTYILGTALIGAFVGSYYGDRAWLEQDSVFTLDPPTQSPLSKNLSIATACFGVGFVLDAICRTYG